MGVAERWYAQKVCESVEGDVIRIWSDCKCANTNLEIYLSNVDLVLINKLFTYLSMHATYILSVHIILVLPKVQAQHIFVKYFATTVFKICHAHTMRHVDLMKSVFYLPLLSPLNYLMSLWKVFFRQNNVLDRHKMSDTRDCTPACWYGMSFYFFGPQVYPMGSMVITFVGLSVSLSVLHEVEGQ